MRQMVFNHASIVVSNKHHTLAWLKDMALGMRELIDTGVSPLHQGLRMSSQGCAIFYSMLYGDFNARWKTEMREEIEFLTELSKITPLIKDAGKDTIDRLSRCQEKTLPSEDGKPLLFCVFTDGIAVGFPSDDTWDRDEVTVQFDELLPDDSIEEMLETIDNLTRLAHAPVIRERHIAALRQLTNPDAFWNAREEAFLRLKFLPSVRERLNDLNSIAWAKVTKALDRMEIGNLSNVKGVGEGISECRINSGPGYRIYFGEEEDRLIILLCGTKQGQGQDIQTARNLWQNYKRE